MKVKDLIKIFGLALILVGLSACASANSSGSSVELAASGQETQAIELPDSLYCTSTAVADRLTINLAPLRDALGNPDEILEVFLYRSGREVGSLGQVGGGVRFQDFVFVNLAPVDAAVFNTSDSVRFALKVVNGQGETVAERNIFLIMQ